VAEVTRGTQIIIRFLILTPFAVFIKLEIVAVVAVNTIALLAINSISTIQQLVVTHLVADMAVANYGEIVI